MLFCFLFPFFCIVNMDIVTNTQQKKPTNQSVSVIIDQPLWGAKRTTDITENLGVEKQHHILHKQTKHRNKGMKESTKNKPTKQTAM